MRTRRLWIVLLSLLFVLGAPVARAQERLFQTWLGVFAQGPITGDLVFSGDLHLRMYEDGSPNWVLVRPAIGLRIAPGMAVHLGYGWTPSWTGRGAGGFTDEHRLFEQWTYDTPLGEGGLRLGLRARFEQRVRPMSEFTVGLRLRLFARLAVPIVSTNRDWLFVVWDELFLAANDTAWGQHAGFDQNRFFVGPGWQAIPGVLRFEAGYFLQGIHRPGNAAGDRFVHAAMLNTYLAWQ